MSQADELRRDLVLVEQIPLYELDGVEAFTLDQQLAFQRLTDAIPSLLDAGEKSNYLVGYDDALRWVLDNITALDEVDRERIEAMRDV